MTLLAILVFTAGALVYRFLPGRWRGWALMLGSILAIYWLQPAATLRPLDFLLPTLVLILAALGWLATRPDGEVALGRDDLLALTATAATVGILALVGDSMRLIPSPPPPAGDLLLAFAGAGMALAVVAPLVSAPGQSRNQALWLLIGLIVVLFAVQKAEGLATGLAAWVRAGAGRPISLASPLDAGWLGFSYVAFRLIHTLRDRQMGKLPALSFREYLTYLIFFPAYTAGPIDRAERFVKDFRALPTLPALDAARAVEGGGRIAIGLIKKFVVADSLAVFALNPALAGQAGGPLDLWVALYAFAFRLYFDFGGYSDIAIGIGLLYGVNLPENFNLPYLRGNITQFWNSWHMTLSTWARLYVFTPLSRALMARKPKPSTLLVVLVAQTATMLVIGLWHGMTLNFVIWGVWHALGLWLHKVYSDRTRPFYQSLSDQPALRRTVNVAGVLLTFHFVALGWVWFALPGTDQAVGVLLRLFGLPGGR
jgi:D-alanyl-lipoteichoic acid acyltransferase DltB (MBOAT superfamily)